MSLRNIVVGVDGGEKSSRALAFSLGLAGREAATLSVCYVRPPVPWTSFALTSMSMFCWDVGALVRASHDHVAAEVAAEASDAFARTGVRGQLVLRSGDVVGELAELARVREADLVVVGRSRCLGGGRFSAARRLTDGYRRALLIAS